MLDVKPVRYKLVGGNGGILGYAVMTKRSYEFEPDSCYPTYTLKAVALREIATAIDSFNGHRPSDKGKRDGEQK